MVQLFMLFARSACLKEVPTISYSLIYGQVLGKLFFSNSDECLYN